MEHDQRPAQSPPPGARFESPFDVPHAPPPPREGAAERLEHLRCDPFEQAEEKDEQRASA
jgi:hypothetical protein